MPEVLSKKEFRNLDFEMPTGGSSWTPKRIFDMIERGDEYETLYDLSTFEDQWRFKEAMGKGWSDLGKIHWNLFSPIRKNLPIPIFRSTDEVKYCQAILPGAYVSESKEYVILHAEANIPGSWKLLTLTVRPDELMTYGDAHEFIYAPFSLDEAYVRYIDAMKACPMYS